MCSASSLHTGARSYLPLTRWHSPKTQPIRRYHNLEVHNMTLYRSKNDEGQEMLYLNTVHFKNIPVEEWKFYPKDDEPG
jgi:hypothetical protein